MKLQCVVTLLMILQYGKDVQAQVPQFNLQCEVVGMVVTLNESNGYSPHQRVKVAFTGFACETSEQFDGNAQLVITVPYQACGTTSSVSPDGSTEYTNEVNLSPSGSPTSTYPVSCSFSPPVAVQCDSDEMVATVDQSRYFTDTHGQPSHVQIEYTLNGDSCQETHNLTEDEVVINIPLVACGTTASESGEQLVYTNVLSAKVVSTPANNTSLDEDVDFTVTCSYNRSEVLSVALDPTVLNQEDVDDYGEFAFQMSLSDSSGLSLDTSNPVQAALGDDLTVTVSVTVSDLIISLERCWATPTSDSNHAIYHTLILGGCEVNPSSGVVVYNCTENTQTEHQFTLDVFRFVPEELYSEVYIHCDAFVCDSSVSSSACDCPDCTSGPGRKRRSPENKADDNYDKGSHVYKVPSIGPIVKVGEDDGKQDYSGEADRKEFPITALIVGLVSGCVAIVVVSVVVILVLRRRKQSATLTVERNNEVSVKLYNQVPAAEQR